MADIKFEFDRDELNMLFNLIKKEIGYYLTSDRITGIINSLSHGVKYEIVKFGVYDYRVKDMIIQELKIYFNE